MPEGVCRRSDQIVRIPAMTTMVWDKIHFLFNFEPISLFSLAFLDFAFSRWGTIFCVCRPPPGLLHSLRNHIKMKSPPPLVRNRCHNPIRHRQSPKVFSHALRDARRQNATPQNHIAAFAILNFDSIAIALHRGTPKHPHPHESREKKLL